MTEKDGSTPCLQSVECVCEVHQGCDIGSLLLPMSKNTLPTEASSCGPPLARPI